MGDLFWDGPFFWNEPYNWLSCTGRYCPITLVRLCVWKGWSV